MPASAELLDVNVWLALAVHGHPHHPSALRAWPELQQPTFCRVTQLGLLRLLCNRQVMGADVFEPRTAWAEYDRLLAAGSVQFLHEPADLETVFKSLAKGGKAARDFWTDAYLAAFAKAGQLRLVTFDSGFSRFANLDCLLLEP